MLSPKKFAVAVYVPAKGVGNVHWYAVVEVVNEETSAVEVIGVHVVVLEVGSATVHDIAPVGKKLEPIGAETKAVKVVVPPRAVGDEALMVIVGSKVLMLIVAELEVPAM